MDAGVGERCDHSGVDLDWGRRVLAHVRRNFVFLELMSWVCSAGWVVFDISLECEECTLDAVHNVPEVLRSKFF